jgi:hypothetical protein
MHARSRLARATGDFVGREYLVAVLIDIDAIAVTDPVLAEADAACAELVEHLTAIVVVGYSGELDLSHGSIPEFRHLHRSYDVVSCIAVLALFR